MLIASENTARSSIQLDDIPAEIRTRDLRNTKRGCWPLHCEFWWEATQWEGKWNTQ